MTICTGNMLKNMCINPSNGPLFLFKLRINAIDETKEHMTETDQAPFLIKVGSKQMIMTWQNKY